MAAFSNSSLRTGTEVHDWVDHGQICLDEHDGGRKEIQGVDCGTDAA